MGSVNFATVTFGGESAFHKAKFSGKALFWKAKFNGVVSFKDAHFANVADFISLEASNNSVLMHELGTKSLSNLMFTRSEKQIFSFRSCRWPEVLGLEKHGAEHENNTLACEELYRAMKQRAAEEHDQPLVSRWHFREKLMQLKQLFNNDRSNNLLEEVEDRDAKWPARAKAWFKLLWHRPHWPKLTLTGLYWATSGFGERAVRAGVWLLALVVLSFALNAAPQPMDWNTLWGAAAANATLATIPFAKDIPGDGWVKVGRGFWQFLIAIQFTLFALAVRNRFRR